MSQVSLFAKVTAKPGEREGLVNVLGKIIEECRSEPGTLMYIMNLDQADPDVVWFFELYSNQAAFQAHLDHRDTMVDLNNEMEAFLAGEAELIPTTPQIGIGLV